MNNDKKERMFELLMDETVFGLDEKETIELNELKRLYPDWEDEFSFEQAAANIALMSADADAALPTHLRSKILADADEYFTNSSSAENQNVFEFAPKASGRANSLATETDANAVETAPKFPFWQWLGWGFAAVACVALAINLWQTRTQTAPEIVKTPPVVTPSPELTLEQKRAQLLASANDVIKTDWSAPTPSESQQISGDIVWSDSAQQGYMRFRGLPVNDRDRETYQLWIFDETQDKKTPINGGVFDVSQTGEVIVPIDPELKVRNPKMFAVTVEKPGGVVVSKQEKIAAVAKIEA